MLRDEIHLRKRGPCSHRLWPLTAYTTNVVALSLDFENTKMKIVSEYDQEIPQSQTADNPVAPRGRAAQPSRDTRKTN